MNGWLSGKTARIIGDHAMISDALNSAGATLLADGSSDILVHVAEAPAATPAHDMTYEQWRHVLDQGLDQRFFAAREFANDCRARGVSGAVLFVGVPEQAFGADQAAAAGALGNLTKTLGVEWARDGIRVNAVLTETATATLGNLAAYLLSDYAAYITGAVLGIDSNDG